MLSPMSRCRLSASAEAEVQRNVGNPFPMSIPGAVGALLSRIWFSNIFIPHCDSHSSLVLVLPVLRRNVCVYVCDGYHCQKSVTRTRDGLQGTVVSPRVTDSLVSAIAEQMEYMGFSGCCGEGT